MKICIINNYTVFNVDNKIFDPLAYTIVEGGERPFVALRERLATLGHSLSTIDDFPLERFDKFIFLDFPSNRIDLLSELKAMGKDLYLILLESEIIKPDNWDMANYSYFKKVFGWKPLARPGYSRLLIAQNMDKQESPMSFQERKLACMVAGNKYNSDPRELYSERRRVIRWFEKHDANEFSLYGMGWESGEKLFDNWLVRRVPLLGKMVIRHYPSYKGSINQKRKILGEYRFNFCFENVSGIRGYLTEKLFDALLSGVVPIYWGAPDVFDFIPRETMIYFPDYPSIDTLYRHLRTMEESEWKGYIEATQRFLDSPSARIFSPDYFAEQLVNGIL